MHQADTRVISTRMTPSEAFLVEIEAERARVTVAEWVRETIRARLRRPQPTPPEGDPSR